LETITELRTPCEKFLATPLDALFSSDIVFSMIRYLAYSLVCASDHNEIRIQQNCGIALYCKK